MATGVPARLREEHPRFVARSASEDGVVFSRCLVIAVACALIDTGSCSC
jgi:hypothetical protein